MNLISDSLTRVRNALLIGQNKVIVRNTKIVKSMFDVMHSEGFVSAVSVVNDREISIGLKYDHIGIPVIRKIMTVSKPSRRTYLKKQQISSLRKKRFSLFVLTTSKGVMSDVDAYNNNVGGEVICEVY